MCVVIMFTAMGTGPSNEEAKHAAAKALLDEMAAGAKALLDEMATGAKQGGSGVGTNSTIPEA